MLLLKGRCCEVCRQTEAGCAAIKALLIVAWWAAAGSFDARTLAFEGEPFELAGTAWAGGVTLLRHDRGLRQPCR